MDKLYVLYALLATLLFWGAKGYGKGEWNEECFSLKQTKMLQGFTAVCIMFHHMAQKTCAPWHEQKYIVHGLDFFVPFGYFYVGIFLFCSGMGLYKSFKTKPDYLKGFIKRRILPIVIAFYASEWIYFIVRLLMKEKMDVEQIIYYITGAQLANSNAWYVIVIPFFYLFFYFSFRFIKKEWLAVLMTGFGIFAYTLLGTFIDHNDFWMRGEWWYNSAHLFFIGLFFAKFEKQIVAFVKKVYYPCLILSFLGMVLFYALGEVTQGMGLLTYYGDGWLPVLPKVLLRWGLLLIQMAASTCHVIMVFLFMMKVKLGNKVLGFLGGLTLELYLIHGIFVELFGFDFMEKTKSLVYIRNVPLYVLAVVACSIPATLLFRLILHPPFRKKKPATAEKKEAS